MTFAPIRSLAIAGGLTFVGLVGLVGFAGAASAADVNNPPVRTLSYGGLAPADIAVAPDGTTYVTTPSVPSIQVFAAGTSGSAAPIRVISGANTGLTTNLLGIALDAAGDIYVTNTSTSSPASTGDIEEFASGASGNAAPTRVIIGAATTLLAPKGIAVAPNGTIYVASNAGILGFASSANGNVAPASSLSGLNTGLGGTQDVAVKSDGSLVVADAVTSSVSTFAPNANGNVAPVSTISGANTTVSAPVYVALDSAGNIYVDNDSVNAILEFPPSASGNVAPANRLIVGTGTNLLHGFNLDGQGSIYVAAGTGTGTGPYTVNVYDPFLVVSSIAATSGAATGGSTVTVTGNGFVAGAAVSFGGVPATSVTVTSLTTLTAVTPAHAAGRADVSVTEGTQLATLPAAFTFVNLLAATGTNVVPVGGLAVALVLVGLLVSGGQRFVARRRRQHLHLAR